MRIFNSEDMFLIKADEAEKHIKPPVLCRIEISPSQTYVQPHSKQSFTVKGFDQFGREFSVTGSEWTATGGSIDEAGTYEAGDKTGNYAVKAHSLFFFAAAAVFISKEKQEMTETVTSPKQNKITWAGVIPPLKWMNFYSKVLSRFVKDCDLIIKVQFEARPKNGISPQQINETKASLSDIKLYHKFLLSNIYSIVFWINDL